MLPFPIRNTSVRLVNVEPVSPSSHDFWEDYIQVRLAQLKQCLVYSADDHTKQKLRFGDILQSFLANETRPDYTFIVFLRRFGCPVCRAVSTGLSRFVKVLQDIVRIKLVAIAIEDIGFEEFRRQKYFSGDIYINEDGSMFKMMELKTLSIKNGFGIFDTPKMNAAVALSAGDYFNHTRDFNGNLVQLGGFFVLDSKMEKFLMKFKEDYAGDTPVIDELLQVLNLSADLMERFNQYSDARPMKILNLAQQVQKEILASSET